jgi:uncharacterized protein (TIGR03382 family)
MQEATTHGESIRCTARPSFGRAGAAVAAVALALACGADAAVVTRWNFNNRSMSATTGTGLASVLRTTHSGYVAGAPQDGTAASNRSLRVGGFSATPGAPRGVQFRADVTGYKDVRVTYWQLNDRSSSRWMQVQYSLNGRAFTSAGLAGGGRYQFLQAGAFLRKTFAIPGTGALDAVESLRFRVVALPAPGTNRFAGTVGPYRPTGMWRFDLVTVTGTSIGGADASTPTPGCLSLLGLAGVMQGRRRRS